MIAAVRWTANLMPRPAAEKHPSCSRGLLHAWHQVEIEERFETTMAFRAMPNMSNKPMIQIFGVLGRNQFVAAPDAINSEKGALIGRHGFPYLLFSVNPSNL